MASYWGIWVAFTDGREMWYCGVQAGGLIYYPDQTLAAAHAQALMILNLATKAEARIILPEYLQEAH